MSRLNHESTSRLHPLPVKRRTSGTETPTFASVLVLAFLVANPVHALGPQDLSQPDYEAVLTKERDRRDVAERKASEANARSEKLAAELKKLKAKTESNNISSNVVTIEKHSSGSSTMPHITISGGGQFPVGSASLSPGAKNVLATVKNIITDRKVELEVIILIGYADENEASNQSQLQRLSEMRAEAAKIYLVSLGIVSSRIYTEGKGTGETYSSPPPLNKRLVLIQAIGKTS